MRTLISEICVETQNQMETKQDQDKDKESLLTFIRPFAERFNMDTTSSGIMDDISFEVYVFFRSFYNPDLEGFSVLNLY